MQGVGNHSKDLKITGDMLTTAKSEAKQAIKADILEIVEVSGTDDVAVDYFILKDKLNEYFN